MLFYLAVLMLGTLFMAAGRRFKSFDTFFYSLLFFLLALVAGLRGDVGQDTYQYGRIYYAMTDVEALKLVLMRQEPLVNLLMYIHNKFFGNYTGFLFLMALVQAGVLFYAVRNIYYRGLFLVFYLLVFYLEFHFNVLRAGTAAIFFMAALSDIRLSIKKAIVWAVLALFSHVSIVVVFPVLLARAGLGVKRFLMVCAISVFVMATLYFIFSELIALKLSIYDLLDTSSFRVPLVTLFLSLIVSASLLMTRNKCFDIIVSVVVMLVVFSFYSFSDIAYRLMNIAMVVFMFLMFEERAVWRASGQLIAKPIIIGGVVLLSWFSFLRLAYVVDEPAERYASGEGLYEFSYIPYEFYFESKYRMDPN